MPADVRAAKAAHEAALFALANVVGLAVGNKSIRGEETDERCVVVYVETKRPESELRDRDIVPRSIAGVRTDVVETGRFHALEVVQSTEVERTRRTRPAPGGVSIGHHRITAGTLGVLARRNGQSVILSNNHVLANANDAAIGDPILQPGPADGGRPEDAIARLSEFVPIRFSDRSGRPIGEARGSIRVRLLRFIGLPPRRPTGGRTNLADAAIAVPIEPGLVAPGVLGIGPVSGTVEADIGLRVRKSGRTTGVTEGRITGVDAVVEVDYRGRTALFREQIVSDMVSQGGDSGSLVVDDRERAVGLLFAGGLTTTLINPISAVSELLGIVVG